MGQLTCPPPPFFINSIVIKGLAEDEAVLCTHDKTFMVRQVNTSNSIILIDRDEKEEQHRVQDNLSHTIELLPCLARTSRLDELLGKSCYSGEENEAALKASEVIDKSIFFNNVELTKVG